MGRREAVESHQDITILDPRRHGLRVFRPAGQGLEGRLGIFSGRRLPEFMSGPFRPGLRRLRQRVQCIAGLVHPTTRLACLGEEFIQDGPEVQRTPGARVLTPASWVDRSRPRRVIRPTPSFSMPREANSPWERSTPRIFARLQ